MFSKKENLEVVGYTNVDCAGSITDRHFTSGYFTFVGGLLTELSFKLEKPIELHCDNKSAIDIAHNQVQHDQTKHVEAIMLRWIDISSKKKIENKIIC
ncbi:unnamed protein product [Prunus armeniaca]